MEVPETSVLHFAFWVSPMAAETESADVGKQRAPPMEVGGPFKTMAAHHGLLFLCCEG
jgi:hypothetical protein